MRAILTGLCLSLIVILMAHYSISIVHGSYLAIDHMPAGGIFIFFILVILINPILGRLNRKLHFSSQELLLVYIMLLVTSSITTMGLGAVLCPIIGGASYYATAENQWSGIIHPYLKPWLFPQGQNVVRYFFEGLPPGEKIPWMAWVKPLTFWFTFIFVLYLAMVFVMVILRKQWVEKERLAYPLVQLPLQMVADDGEERLIKPFFRNKLMWLGFAVPFFISSWNGLHHYFHFIPALNLMTSSMHLQFRLSFPIMGLTYLINQEVAFSAWFFSVLFRYVLVVFNRIGISSTENVGPFGCLGNPIFSNLGTGAFFTFVVLGLWIARAHLKEVFGKAFGKREVDDSGEIISYKMAVWGLITAMVFLLIWLVFSGMSVLLAVLFLIAAFIFWIGLTRIVAEAGIATMVAPSIASSQVVSGLGSSTIGPQGVTSLGLTYVYSADLRTFPMSSTAQGLKIGEKFSRTRGIFLVIVLSIILAFIASNWIVLRLAYRHGGINLNQWYFVGAAKAPFDYVISHIKHATDPNRLGWFCRLTGAGLMGILMAMRYRFLWWPLHPLGFAIGPVFLMPKLWFSIFLVWLIKLLFLKYGGVRLFHKARPFFLGLILGQYTAACLWLAVDSITGHTENMVFWI